MSATLQAPGPAPAGAALGGIAMPPPSVTSAATPPPVGLIGRPWGDLNREALGSDAIPSTIGQTINLFGLTKDVGRLFEEGRDIIGASGSPVINPATGEIDMAPQPPPAEPMLPATDLNKQFGIPGRLQFNKPGPASAAKLQYDAARQSMLTEDAIARYPDGFLPNAARLGVDFAAQMLDPVNIATAFIPGIGEARAAGMVARLGLDGVGATIGTRAIMGGSAMALGQGAISGLTAGLSLADRDDYTAMDALADVAMGAAQGAAMGAIFHVGGGAFGDMLDRRFRESPAGAAVENPATNEAAARTAVAQVVGGQPVEVNPIIWSGATDDAEVRPGKISRPQSLLSFLVSLGGVKDEAGELESLDARIMRPGLVSGRGKSLDYAREAAEEAGYLKPDSSPNDLLDAIGEELAGRKVYTPEDVETARQADQARLGDVERSRFDESLAEVHRIADEQGITLMHGEHEYAAVQMMQGVEPDAAIEEAQRIGDLAMRGDPSATAALQKTLYETGGDIGAAGEAHGSAGMAHEEDFEGFLDPDAVSIAFDNARHRLVGIPDAQRQVGENADAAMKVDFKPKVQVSELEDHIADLENTLRIADEAGLLTDADRAEIADAGAVVQQQQSRAKAFMQAAACLMGLG